MKSIVWCLGCLVICPFLQAADGPVGPVPAELRERHRLGEFYQKHVTIHGFPILGSERVSDYALLEAAWILRHMLEGREEILKALTERRVHLTVMAYNEYTTDVPEHAHLKPRVFWDRRARGLGGSPVSCGEENLLGYPNDPYVQENLLIHEFAHVIHGIAMRTLDPTFDKRLKAAYESAVQRNLWQGTYAGSNHSEYWAEAVQSWFDNNRQNDALHNHVDTRDELKEYDPELAALCAEVLGDGDWRYRKPSQRPAEETRHVEGLDRQNLPRFRWREEPVPEQPKVLLQTSLGDIELELDAVKAPLTVRNFLHYVHEGYYNDGEFFRIVRTDNQPADRVPIEVVQARSDPARAHELAAPIALERTRDTGLRHLDATVSMARDGCDTAQDHFFICVGDQPELDFGGSRHQDGEGFAAFGRVTKGMDVVRKIHAAPADGELLTPPIRLQRAIRLN